MPSLAVGEISSFFRWKLDQTRGKCGRKLRGTKDASSLKTYKKQFSILYRKLAEKDMDSKLAGQLRMVDQPFSHVREHMLMCPHFLQVMPEIAEEYRLSHTPREKPAMDVYDVREVAQTAITTTEKMFKIGRYRIQTIFFMLGGFITANRPDALLKLQYRHVKATILRDPLGGPHKILLELTYEFTKTFLGPKAPYVFP